MDNIPAYFWMDSSLYWLGLLATSHAVDFLTHFVIFESSVSALTVKLTCGFLPALRPWFWTITHSRGLSPAYACPLPVGPWSGSLFLAVPQAIRQSCFDPNHWQKPGSRHTQIQGVLSLCSWVDTDSQYSLCISRPCLLLQASFFHLDPWGCFLK